MHQKGFSPACGTLTQWLAFCWRERESLPELCVFFLELDDASFKLSKMLGPSSAKGSLDIACAIVRQSVVASATSSWFLRLRRVDHGKGGRIVSEHNDEDNDESSENESRGLFRCIAVAFMMVENVSGVQICDLGAFPVVWVRAP